MGLNVCVFMGRLTADCELRYTKSEKAVASFTIGVDRGRDAEALFLDCVAWEKRALTIDQYFKKGDMIVVRGELDSRKYEDKNGNKRTAYELSVKEFSFCGGKNENANEKPRYQTPVMAEIEDEEPLPF